LHCTEHDEIHRQGRSTRRKAAGKGGRGLQQTTGPIAASVEDSRLAPYKAECEELAEALGCNYFYSGSAGSADNADIIKVWKEAGGCVVATTALGTGVNYAGVALAVHVGMLYGLIDFAQKSGRAGRGGEVVTSLILLEKNWQAREGAKRMGNTLTVQPLMSGSRLHP